MTTRTLLHSALLPIELTNGNDGRGGTWHKSSANRKGYEQGLRLLGHSREPFDEPVTVHITRILGRGQKLWDNDSIGRGNSKEIIDALVALGWWHDDSPKWIAEVRFFQDKSRRKDGPATLIEIFEMG